MVDLSQNELTNVNIPVQCESRTRSGARCRSFAIEGDLYCYHHSPARHEQRKETNEYLSEIRKRPSYVFYPPKGSVFSLSRAEINRRIRCLTPRQLEALEFVVSGRSFDRHGEALGIVARTFQSRLSSAQNHTGMLTRAQLICLYAIWRAQSG
jgi:hypothetical protein